ncbi:GL15474 [Drosophila persimilis]|uniref:GL15474 n=1 Tax=Drosophila persimilis TaxID=7234 RepID=B4GPX2_DROPE|nr:GL15474 [Drosophila persimilis]
MGVRGLTSYIAQRAEIYLKPYELHSTALVIDGDNLACNLYKDVTGCYSAFGGDYDDFYRAVLQFFQVLDECSIRPYVLMDGGYEERKLQTVGKRLRGKISVIKKINPNASITLFPLHLKEVFVDAVKDCGVPIMRCVFEADDELAALARKLNCPVLSYDSDFYIHNVKYIPLITLTVKVLTKQVKQHSKPKDTQDLRMGKAGRSKKLKQQQRRIRVTLQWLRGETAESALAKVLSRLKKSQRDSLVAQVNAAIEGYSNELCHAYDFFEDHYENAFPYFEPVSEEEQSDEEDPLGLDDDSSDADGAEEEGEQQEENENKPAPGENEAKSNSEEDEEEPEGGPELEVEDKTLLFPQWFLDKLYPGHLSRFFVDLLHLRKYINNPQIEHFPHHDSNELALPILNYVFALLHNVEGSKTEPRVNGEGVVLPIEYTYLTRAVRVTNVRYHKMPIEKPLAYTFVPSAPDARHLRAVFESKVPHAKTEQLFAQLERLPEDLRLYFLAIVYWLHRSEHCDLLHLHALLLCLVVLRTIDVTIPAEREVKSFHRRFGKILKQERAVRDKEAAEGIKRGVKPSLLDLPVPERMAHVPKSDCYLVQERLLPHFHMQEIFKKKFDLYSTTVLHAFAEFQAVVYQLNGLNSLLDHPLPSPRMNQLYCGAFLYNLYDLLRNRPDVRYHVEHYLLSDSQLMFDFYCYLFDWCADFIPSWKQTEVDQAALKVQQKKRFKKERQAARKAAAASASTETADPNADMLRAPVEDPEPEDDFFDLNNKFCALKVA